MTVLTSPIELFKEELNKIYSVEKELLGVLDTMAASANSLTLKNAFKKHLDESNQQLARLQQVSATVGVPLVSSKSSTISSLIADALSDIQRNCITPGLKDALLIAAAQKIEYFEMASYATLRSLALSLDLNSSSNLLQQSINEESLFDEILEGIYDNEIFSDIAGDPAFDFSLNYIGSDKEDQSFTGS